MNNAASAVLRDEVKMLYRRALCFQDVIIIHFTRANVSSSVGRLSWNSVM